MILLYTTIGTEEDARKISTRLLEKKLIACANIFPIKCIYRWQEKITDEREVAMIIKTTEENVIMAKKEIEKIHPYDVPCILELPATANAAYARWITEQVS